ncbi:hypothetical protein K466DRAFT_570303 [Polyporus arcularius HHB13444]|uniref:DDE-1 domain-containing protein n=1 Tax=Polyporus arcularius HHB13444 TaxID=1314778 RepID=A0A5C3NRE8_9APHY|nr:hypothetical protein K466DRAFT_570303 [Polyporus arcularius HHB13444]
MLLAKAAWDAVSAETIQNCWKKAFQLDSAATLHITITEPPKDWQILLDFASGKIESMQQAESKLQKLLGTRYNPSDWKAAFDAIFVAEDDQAAAIAGVERLHSAVLNQNQHTSVGTQDVPQLAAIKVELMEQVRGTRPTLNDLLNPAAEIEVSELLYRFPGGDKNIIEEVCKQGQSQAEDVIELSDDEEESVLPEITYSQGMDLCAQLERLCSQYSDAPGVNTLSLQTQVRRLQAHLRLEDGKRQKQTTLDSFWSHAVAPM